MKKIKNGFTLFELLVSISIIAILTALAIISYSSAQKKARDTRRQEDVQMMAKAAEQYYSQNSYSYPQGTTVANWTPASSGTPLLNVFPVDPKNVAPYTYNYTTNAPNFTLYCVCAHLESGTGNSSTNGANGVCDYSTPGPYFCASNQQ